LTLELTQSGQASI